MTITWDDLTVTFDEESSERLLDDWKWLVGTDKNPILISSIGDMFLRDGADKVYWLNF